MFWMNENLIGTKTNKKTFSKDLLYSSKEEYSDLSLSMSLIKFEEYLLMTLIQSSLLPEIFGILIRKIFEGRFFISENYGLRNPTIGMKPFS